MNENEAVFHQPISHNSNYFQLEKILFRKIINVGQGEKQVTGHVCIKVTTY